MLEALVAEVLKANCALPANGLAPLTWGNASGIDREQGLVAIKPSGVAYDELTEDDIVVVDLDGNVVHGERRPSTDTPTHLVLYRAFEEIGAVVHTHSTWSVAWAQAQREIPVLGTTHADLCAYPIPVTRALTDEEIATDYEGATGTVLVETIAQRGPEELPCALVRGHAPFCWGATPAKAVDVAITLEQVARMALLTSMLEPGAEPLQDAVRDKHHDRKHGPRAYYGATVTTQAGLEAAEQKMREAGQPDEAIRSFASAYERLVGGESAMLPSAELEPAGDVDRLEELPDVDAGEVLDRVAVIKLNGGLATTMGLRSPKSLLEAREGRLVPGHHRRPDAGAANVATACGSRSS